MSVQTDTTIAELHQLESDNYSRQEEITLLKEQIGAPLGFPTEEKLKEDSKLLGLYTGFSNFLILKALFEVVAKAVPHSRHYKLSAFSSFILTMMKLRLNTPNLDLAYRFGISESTVGRILKWWIYALDSRMSSALIKWPSHEALRRTMPFCFRVHYGLRVAAIIDCFEIFIEKPSNLLAKASTWSQYKHYNTAKYLISITPQGVVNFISKGWGGCASDRYIVENSGFLNNILPGDVILADRGFNIEDSVGAIGASLQIPAFTRGKNQLAAKEVESTRNIANVRIHIERVIGAIRQRFTILSATGVLSKDLFQQKSEDGVLLLDAIVRVCCCLNNLCEGIIPFD